MAMVSRQHPAWGPSVDRAMRSRRPTMRKPACSCSRRLAVFPGNTLAWIVQYPAASAAMVRMHVHRVLDDPAIHLAGRDRGGGRPPDQRAARVDGDQTHIGDLAGVELLPRRCPRLERRLARRDPVGEDLLDGGPVGRRHRPNGRPRALTGHARILRSAVERPSGIVARVRHTMGTLQSPTARVVSGTR